MTAAEARSGQGALAAAWWALALLAITTGCARENPKRHDEVSAAAGTGGRPGMADERVSIDGRVVNSATGATEAGVWIITETSSLPVLFRKIVVTDEQGRFLVPDLPAGSYTLWVRGYGLRDSSRVSASRGDHLVLRVEPARNAREAAQSYPANYWFSLYE